MLAIAFQMLTRDRGKYFGIIMGVTLASLVIVQQGSIFVGLMTRTFAVISDMGDPDIWVMEPKVQFIDDTKPLQDTTLNRVRGVEGVAWAMPLYKGLLRARLADGGIQNCNVFGLDDATLAGGPPRMVEGKVEDLWRADAVIVDAVGAATRLAKPNPGGGKPIPLRVGDTLELNDRRATVVGISQNSRSFQSQPTIYTTYSRAVQFAPRERKLLSFVLVKAKPGVDKAALCDEIALRTGLAAYQRDDFKWKTVMYFVRNTGIPVNFGISVLLGFVVGSLITGFMFYSFTADNLRYFGTLKAMGASDARLVGMIVTQAVVVSLVGFGLGCGLAAFIGRSASGTSPLAFRMIWQVVFLAGCAVTVIGAVSAVLSMVRVLRLEPAVVFKG
jgi:putative ABC transport system permease protein